MTALAQAVAPWGAAVQLQYMMQYMMHRHLLIQYNKVWMEGNCLPSTRLSVGLSAPPSPTHVSKWAMSARRRRLRYDSTADVMMENQVMTKMQTE